MRDLAEQHEDDQAEGSAHALGFTQIMGVEMQSAVEAMVAKQRELLARDVGEGNALSILPPMPKEVTQVAVGRAEREDGEKQLLIVAKLLDGTEVSLAFNRELASALLAALPDQLAGLDEPSSAKTCCNLLRQTSSEIQNAAHFNMDHRNLEFRGLG